MLRRTRIDNQRGLNVVLAYKRCYRHCNIPRTGAATCSRNECVPSVRSWLSKPSVRLRQGELTSPLRLAQSSVQHKCQPFPLLRNLLKGSKSMPCEKDLPPLPISIAETVLKYTCSDSYMSSYKNRKGERDFENRLVCLTSCFTFTKNDVLSMKNLSDTSV